MAAFTIVDGLPYVVVTLHANGQRLSLAKVVLDTGSVNCLFKTRDLETIGVTIEGSDYIHIMRGIGGREAVIEKQIDGLEIDANLFVRPFMIQHTNFDYGLDIDGILGMDFLLAAKAIIDLDALTLTKRPQ